MKGNIRARVLKGLGANAFGQLVIAAIQVAGLPILLHYWGARLYGEWLILFAIPAYLSITDLGFSQSAANDMTARLAGGERKRALEVFQSLAGLVFLSAGIALLVVIVLTIVLLPDHLQAFQAMPTTDVRWVLLLLAAEVLVKLAQGVGHAAFRANGDYPFIATLYSSALLLQNLGMWCIAAVGFGPVIAATAFVSVRVSVAVFEALLLTRRYSWIRFGFAHARIAVLRQLVRPALANVAAPLARALSIQGMVLIVGAALGPVAVITFTALRTLTRILVQGVLGISNAMEADFAAAYGANKIGLLRTLYLHSLRGGIWLIFIGTALLFNYGEWLLIQWTQGKIVMDAALFHWLLGTAAAGVLSQSGLALLRASNRHLRAAVLSVFTSGAAVALSWVLLQVTHLLALVGPSLFVTELIFAAFTLRAAGMLCDIGPISGLVQSLNPLPLIRLLYEPRHARRT